LLIVVVFSVTVDYAICGLAPLGEYLVILFYDEQFSEDVCADFVISKLCLVETMYERVYTS